MQNKLKREYAVYNTTSAKSHAKSYQSHLSLTSRSHWLISDQVTAAAYELLKNQSALEKVNRAEIVKALVIKFETSDRTARNCYERAYNRLQTETAQKRIDDFNFAVDWICDNYDVKDGQIIGLGENPDMDATLSKFIKNFGFVKLENAVVAVAER